MKLDRKLHLPLLGWLAAVVLLALVAALLGVARHSSKGLLVTQENVLRVDWQQIVGRGPTWYGVEYSWVDQDRDLFLERYRLLSPNLLRVQISQEYFEPANDNADPNLAQFDFDHLTVPLDSQEGKTITFRDMFASLAKEFPDMHFHLNIWLAARWNAANPEGYLGLGGAFPPLNYAEHAEFVRELARWLVESCGIAPQRLSFSFTNEPNLKPFFTGSQAELVRIAAETRRALDQVSPHIRMDGLDEVHGTALTETFYPLRPAGCCGRWTFHAYEREVDALWSALQRRLERLSAFGPVWVTEFADTANGSLDAEMDFSTHEAALGFAVLLGRLWSSGIDGIVHFRLADSYLQGQPLEGWAGHGLFADWRGTKSKDGEPYGLYPAFWVFANFYNEMAGGQVIPTTNPDGLVAAASRHSNRSPACLVLWLTNPGAAAYTATLQIVNFPSPQAELLILDNLSGREPIETRLVAGAPLAFQINMPPHSTYTLQLRTKSSITAFEVGLSQLRRLYLPLVNRQDLWSAAC